MARQRRHNAEQIIATLREADVKLAEGPSAGQVRRRLEVSEHSYRRRRPPSWSGEAPC